MRTWAKTIDKMELLCFNKFTINSIFFYNILSENRKYKNSAVLLNATASTNCFVSRTLRGESTAVILGYVTCFHWCQGIGDDLLLCGDVANLSCTSWIVLKLPCTSVSMAQLSCMCWPSWTWAMQYPHIPWTAREGTQAPQQQVLENKSHIHLTLPHFWYFPSSGTMNLTRNHGMSCLIQF